ncbi:hypothetical protein G7009_18130 [Pseudomonas capeferrum]|uniref:hypothetical protein n=1 Tax=Pseudomonas TaxID=286 RepID=UPI0015E2D606|nr:MULTISPECIES: hypothetical protein [Pseudomonas]MBA1203643.1 hypothetical protein [Pseudomonas capeferrum]
MEKYSNRRVLHRKGGKFASAPTLEQQGYAINTSRFTCAECSHEWAPILVPVKCPKCSAAIKSE